MSAAPCRTFVGQRFFELAKATGQGADLDAVRESTTRRNGQRRKPDSPSTELPAVRQGWGQPARTPWSLCHSGSTSLADSRRNEVESLSLTTDSLSHEVESLSLTADSLSHEVEPLSLTADSLSHEVESLSLTADSLSHEVESLSLTADALSHEVESRKLTPEALSDELQSLPFQPGREGRFVTSRCRAHRLPRVRTANATDRAGSLAWNRIAEILALSPHTVRDYVQDIYRRAGVNGYEKLVSKLANANGASPSAKDPMT
jgi:hypothetical protein